MTKLARSASESLCKRRAPDPSLGIAILRQEKRCDMLRGGCCLGYWMQRGNITYLSASLTRYRAGCPRGGMDASMCLLRSSMHAIPIRHLMMALVPRDSFTMGGSASAGEGASSPNSVQPRSCSRHCINGRVSSAPVSSFPPFRSSSGPLNSSTSAQLCPSRPSRPSSRRPPSPRHRPGRQRHTHVRAR
jgi:hypothetical protein